MKFVPVRLLASALIAAIGVALPALANDEECLDGQVMHVAGCVDLETVMADDLQLSGAWVRAMQPGQKVAGAYLTILNRGEEPDRLLGAATLAAARIDIHDMRMDGDVMSMRPIDGGLEIAPGNTVELKPGGLHFMLADVGEPLEAEDSIEVTLDFEKAGTVVIEFPVRQPATPKAHNH